MSVLKLTSVKKAIPTKMNTKQFHSKNRSIDDNNNNKMIKMEKV